MRLSELMARHRGISRRSLGLGLLAIAYLQVSVGFIATGGTSGLLEYGYAWLRDAGIPGDQIAGVTFLFAALTMVITAIARHWYEPAAAIGYAIAAFAPALHMLICIVGALRGDLDPLEYQAALGSQIGIVVILILLHDWPDPPRINPAPPTALEADA